MIGLLTPSAPARPPARDKPRDYISYSAITTYQSCPLRYYFRYIARVPEQIVASSLVFGSAVHRAVEHHFNELMAGNDPPSVESLCGEYDRHWNDVDLQSVQFGKDDGRESLDRLAARMFGAFQASPLSRPEGQILGVEEEIRANVIADCPELLGRIDLLIESADELVLTDLKTSRSRWSQEQVDDAAGQLLLYHELIRSFAPGKNVRLQFAVLTKKKEPVIDLHQIPVDARRIDRTKRIVERVWRGITSGNFYPTPSPLACGGCPFRQPCRDWQG